MSTAGLWTSPDRGHRFVTRELWHSCSDYPLDHHFRGREPHVRAAFERFLQAVRASGPVAVIPRKAPISIQGHARFAGCVARKRRLPVNLWLTRRVEHPRLQRIAAFGPRSFGHQFRLAAPDDIDAG